MPLTVDEKMNCDARRARSIAAEKHFFDQAQPFYPLGFSVIHRNLGHWDIFAERCHGMHAAFMAANPSGFSSAKDGDRERAFRIRGEPGNVVVLDERWDPHRPHPREPLKFRSVSAAMFWIMEELMQEPAE